MNAQNKQFGIEQARHLYVLQSPDGFIKIGRSKQPHIRRLQLENARHCGAILVSWFADRGSEEQEILNAMWEHRYEGEWFFDTPASRTLLIALLGELSFEDNINKFPLWRGNHPLQNPNVALRQWLIRQEIRRSKQTAGTKFIYLVKPRWDLASFTQGSPAG